MKNIPIEMMNRVDEVAIQDSVRNLPHGYDTPPGEIRRLAREGDVNARHIVLLAVAGSEEAKGWTGERFSERERDIAARWGR